jgi:hypothetical protein
MISFCLVIYFTMPYQLNRLYFIFTSECVVTKVQKNSVRSELNRTRADENINKFKVVLDIVLARHQ